MGRRMGARLDQHLRRFLPGMVAWLDRRPRADGCAAADGGIGRRRQGGPGKRSFDKRGVSLDLLSARNYVYGPGANGITIEYLHSFQGDGSAPIKFLLTRPGSVTNLGDNIFQLDFATPMDEYEVRAQSIWQPRCGACGARGARAYARRVRSVQRRTDRSLARRLSYARCVVVPRRKVAYDRVKNVDRLANW